jgi:predicted DNA-binding transcriptional regulator YafY
VFWINQQINQKGCVSTSEIIERFEITNRTVLRTIEYMRDRFELPIKYCVEKKAYHYTEPVYHLPIIELTEGELVAIVLSGELIKQYKGTSIGGDLESAIGKILSNMTSEVSVYLGNLFDIYSFEPSTANKIDLVVFQQLSKAIKDKLIIEMTYFTAETGIVRTRRVEPLHLRNHLGKWYLIAFDYLRQAVRDFYLGRIQGLQMTEEHFMSREDFDLKAYLNKGFSMIRDEKPVEVEMVFDQYQARWVREQAPMHVSEQREELPDGELKVRLQLTALDGIKRFVMQYGSHVRVIAPLELQQAIKSEINQMQELYK